MRTAIGGGFPTFLVSAEVPQVSGGNAFLWAAPGTTLGEVGLYEIVPEAQTGILRVAAAHKIWAFRHGYRLQVRARLVPTSLATASPIPTNYELTDPGVSVFFVAPPDLVIGVAGSDSRLPEEVDAILDMLDSVELTAGRADDSQPAARLSCSELRHQFETTKLNDAWEFRVSLKEVLPAFMLTPGFDIHLRPIRRCFSCPKPSRDWIPSRRPRRTPVWIRHRHGRDESRDDRGSSFRNSGNIGRSSIRYRTRNCLAAAAGRNGSLSVPTSPSERRWKRRSCT